LSSTFVNLGDLGLSSSFTFDGRSRRVALGGVPCREPGRSDSDSNFRLFGLHELPDAKSEWGEFDLTGTL